MGNNGLIADTLTLLVYWVAEVFIWIIILRVVLSWLISFNVVNSYNPYVRMFARFADSVSEPFLRPIRRVLPDLGGLDISPMILLVAIFLLRYFLIGLLQGRALFG
jgi:YggT family protein